jgi:hypothetical protein
MVNYVWCKEFLAITATQEKMNSDKMSVLTTEEGNGIVSRILAYIESS